MLIGTCNPWDISSESWGDMTWPKKLIQRRIEDIFKRSILETYYFWYIWSYFETWTNQQQHALFLRCIYVHCTMCTLFNNNSARLSKLGHILKNLKKYFYEYIFFPALTTRRKMEKSKFLWFSNSKFAIFCDFRVIFPDFECSKNNVSSAGK